jgi:hypothetical protein
LTADSEHEGQVKLWLWRSRPGTTDHGIFSVLSVVEVLFAISCYWAVAIYAHTQLHLLVGVLAAPLLLLRSDQSIKLGIDWFRRFDPANDADISWTARVVEWMLKKGDQIDASGFLGSRALGVAANFTLFIVAILAGVVIPAVAAVLIRVIATFRYFVPGLQSLSSNWWRTLFATDIFSRPEVMPGYSGASPFDFASLTKRFQESRQVDFLNWSLSFLVFVCFIPSYLYRLGIKSTAWVHWPLAYISRPLRYADDPEEVQLRLWSDPREWLRRVAMIVTLCGALIASVPSFAVIRDTFPTGVVSIVEYAVLIDVKSLIANPWRAVALISATITLLLTWYGLELSILVKRSTANPDRLVRAGDWATALEYVMRIRDLCGWIFWALVFVHAGLWLAPSTAWLTGYPREILQFIYGNYFPS